MQQFQEDRRKLKELILYISQQLASKHNFGLVILYKILYFSDHFAYGKLGKPITGTNYVKEKRGPLPPAAYTARQELEREGRLREEPVPYGRGTFQRPVPLDSPDTSMFSQAEIAVVDAIIERFRHSSTRKVKTASHDLKQWRAYKIGETIPYETVFISPNQRLTRKEIAIGQDIARRHGWTRAAR